MCVFCVFSQVLVQFAGIVLECNESTSGCDRKQQQQEKEEEEKAGEETNETNEEDAKTEAEIALKDNCE